MESGWFADDAALRQFVSRRLETDAWKALEPRLAGPGQDAPRLATFALGHLHGQAECGYRCPACMTDGAALVLDRYAASGRLLTGA